MDIKKQLNVEVAPDRVILQPNRRLKTSLIWMAGIAVVVGIGVAIFFPVLSEGPKVLGLALVVYLAGHGLYDYLFHYNVGYEFDKYTNTVYKINPPFGKKKIMRLDEMVLFTQMVTGEWYYAIGIKKKQFLKNYKISPSFDDGKASKKMLIEFEEMVLNPIMALVPEAL
ncbi:hypothetical protein [Chitinophaga qingshengii]|uniref:YcxB family protein n=1 Tax=Chitinophaga qingshengii TaxID=1569794 RepID=A0ABR7TRM4_9BACT|nr:hypothetical protein [Chitinophaga qingshengii]MBC9933136.1 hypothetical protein [Chitinophaga qingshengii]